MKPQKTAWSQLFTLWLLLLGFASGCATIPFDYPRPVSSALLLPEATGMGRKIQPLVVKHRGESGFYLLNNSIEAFLARALLVDRAEKTLDMQYYIFRADLTGKFLLDRIIAAAERGVRVRLLLDDWLETGRMDWWLTMMELHPNIEVRIFNPFGGLRSNPLDRPLAVVFGPRRLQGRMHNKAFIVDNSVAIVGGRNIADEYFGASSEINWRDVDLMAVGPIARDVSKAFDDYWNCVLSIPIKAFVSRRHSPEELERARRDLARDREALKASVYGEKIRQSDLMKKVEASQVPYIWAPGEVLYDDPLKVVHAGESAETLKMARQLRDLLEAAQSELLMISPYFVPRKAGVQWFRKIQERGITIKVLTNSLASTDSPASHFAYRRYRKPLLRLGVELFEQKPTPGPGAEDVGPFGGSGSSSHGALHAKLLVVDRKTVFVGSFNLDPRSARYDTQNGLVVNSPELGAQAAEYFAQATAPARSFRVTFRGLSPGQAPMGDDLVWITAENGREKRYYHEPMSGFWRRIPLSWFALFTPEVFL